MTILPDPLQRPYSCSNNVAGIDATAAHMCYLQLSLLGIPAEVVIGNTLTLAVRRTYRTPMWYVGNWQGRLGTADVIDALCRFLKG